MELSTAINLIDTPHLSTPTAQRWADLGAGSGLFTRALANYLQPGSSIIAVDEAIYGLRKLLLPPDISLQPMQADFDSHDFQPRGLSGILMANALHFVKDQAGFLQRMRTAFAAKPCWLMVEYDMDTANPWVPYPLSFASLKKLFNSVGYETVEKISETPSAFGRSNIYAAWIE
jgi:trans-aconitate methyltransferase